MFKRRDPRTLLELVVARAGGGFRAVPKATRVGTFICEWCIATRELEPGFGVDEFARWNANESRATVYRRLDEYRELFPEFETPAPFAEVVNAGVDHWLEGPSLLTVPLDLSRFAPAA